MMYDLTEEQYNNLIDVVKNDLVKGEDGIYRTKDNDALKKAKDREKAEKDTLKTQYEQAQAKLAEYEKKQQEDKEKGLADKGEWVKLEEVYNAKLTEKQAAFEQEKQGLIKNIHDLTVGSTAKSLAKELTTVPDLFADRIAARLDYVDGKLMVKDREGKPSAMSIDDLKKEYLTDEALKPIMIANAASGGNGVTASKSNPSGASSTDLAKLSSKERATLALDNVMKRGL